MMCVIFVCDAFEFDSGVDITFGHRNMNLSNFDGRTAQTVVQVDFDYIYITFFHFRIEFCRWSVMTHEPVQ